jgi:beta-lactamase class A
MPARRPYASRGVPRRATTRRSGDAGSSAGLAVLVALLVVIGAGVVWLADPFSSSKQGAARPSLVSTSGPAGAGNSADSSSQTLQMADVAAPDSTSSVTATSIPTLRQWDTSTSDLISDPGLVRRLDQALAGVDGRVSVAVKDLGSGRGAMLDGDRELPAASLFKLPILFAVFETGLRMSEELPITAEARGYDSDTLELGVGETLTVAEALERMVTISDNTAAVMLGSRTGSARINADIAALGMDSTHYSLERMTTSASDMLHFVDLLANGKMVSAAASADMLHLLLRQRVNDRLPRLLPNGVEVAHKTGNLPGTVNDVGIIYGPTNTLAVAALVSDTSDETAAASGIAQLSLAAYTYFADQPENANRPSIPRPPARQIPPVWREPHPVPTATLTPVPDELPASSSADSTPTPALSRPTAGPAATAAPAAPAPAAPAAMQTTQPTAAAMAATATPVPTRPPPTGAPAAPTRTPPARATPVIQAAPATATPAKH